MLIASWQQQAIADNATEVMRLFPVERGILALSVYARHWRVHNSVLEPRRNMCHRLHKRGWVPFCLC